VRRSRRATSKSGNTISGSTAEGHVTTAEHVDTYAISGSVTDFTFLEGEATLTLNSEEVTPAELPGDTSVGSNGAGADSTAAD
jgi:hypothetical protein